MKNLLPEEPEESLIQMGPLIDCVFLLLIFFMVVALTKKSQWVLPLGNAPSAVQSPRAEERPEPLEIVVASSGAIQVGGGPLTADGLATLLREWNEQHAGRTVWIKPHQNATLGQVAPVFEAARVAGVPHVRVWTEVRPP